MPLFKRSGFINSLLSLVTVGGLVIALGLIVAASPISRSSSQAVSTETMRPMARPIEQVRVGDRVAPAANPGEEFDETLGLAVDPRTWKHLKLRASKRDGTYADVELLRPDWWLEEQQAEVGGSVYITVPECGIDGFAKVEAITECPLLQPGTGQTVIGTFHHSSASIVDVGVEGLDAPIGTTANHLFWSANRDDFVPAGKLQVGERLITNRGIALITSISARGPPEPVFNVEVLGEHVYQVSSLGVLVHNSGQIIDCAPEVPKGKSQVGYSKEYAEGYDRAFGTKTADAKAPKPLKEWLADDPELLDEARDLYKTSPEWQGIDPDNTPVFYRTKTEVDEIRAKPGESGGHHPHGLALGGPEGQQLTITNETRTVKNPDHNSATGLQRRIINRIKAQLK